MRAERGPLLTLTTVHSFVVSTVDARGCLRRHPCGGMQRTGDMLSSTRFVSDDTVADIVLGSVAVQEDVSHMRAPVRTSPQAAPHTQHYFSRAFQLHCLDFHGLRLSKISVSYVLLVFANAAV